MGGLCRRTLPARRLAEPRVCALRLGPDWAHFPHRSQFPPRTSDLLPTIRPRFPNPRSRPRKPRQNPRRPLPQRPCARAASSARSPRSDYLARPASGEQVSCGTHACEPLSALEPSSSRSTLLSCAWLSSASLSSPCLDPPPPVSLALAASVGHSLGSLSKSSLD